MEGDHRSGQHNHPRSGGSIQWFDEGDGVHILREAEFNGGRLKGVGARIVAETFHRAIEGSHASISRLPRISFDDPLAVRLPLVQADS